MKGQSWYKRIVKQKTVDDLVKAVFAYPQFADSYSKPVVKAAVERGYVRLKRECAEGHCVDVLHITYKGKQWYKGLKRK
jgi:hypothetical protein